jgi:hypothetical protein
LRRLRTPPIPCVVPPDVEPPVFDAFAWCTSDWLAWRTPVTSAARRRAFDEATRLDGSDPTRMVFVFHEGIACDFLPRELARLHALGLGLEDEEALAPWGIDTATDELYAHRVAPRDVLWLAADNLNALFWGLHDWAHFHNHGPFEQRAWTELQCDVSALAWLWINRGEVRIEEAVWERLRSEANEVTRRRFEEEGVASDGRTKSLGSERLLTERPENGGSLGSERLLTERPEVTAAAIKAVAESALRAADGAQAAAS